jgi:hypothetical protein
MINKNNFKEAILVLIDYTDKLGKLYNELINDGILKISKKGKYRLKINNKYIQSRNEIRHYIHDQAIGSLQDEFIKYFEDYYDSNKKILDAFDLINLSYDDVAIALFKQYYKHYEYFHLFWESNIFKIPKRNIEGHIYDILHSSLYDDDDDKDE